MTVFQRARSKEQREVRRRAILDTAAAMLAEMPAAQLTLNELSRRVGLAKSNVLRYFESREAVLLELLDALSREWLDQLATELDDYHIYHAARGELLSQMGRDEQARAARLKAHDLTHNQAERALLRHQLLL